MKKFLTLLVFAITVSCSQMDAPSNEIVENFIIEKENLSTPTFTVPINEVLTINDELYKLKISVDSENNRHQLIFEMELFNNSYFVSPNSKREFKGKFYYDFGSYENVEYTGKVIETPLSKEIYDAHPFTDGLVNWVNVNTLYKQPFYVKSEKDFKVFGRVRFTIEPRCSLEEIPFSLIYKNGKFSVTMPKC